MDIFEIISKKEKEVDLKQKYSSSNLFLEFIKSTKTPEYELSTKDRLNQFKDFITSNPKVSESDLFAMLEHSDLKHYKQIVDNYPDKNFFKDLRIGGVVTVAAMLSAKKITSPKQQQNSIDFESYLKFQGVTTSQRRYSKLLPKSIYRNVSVDEIDKIKTMQSYLTINPGVNLSMFLDMLNKPNLQEYHNIVKEYKGDFVFDIKNFGDKDIYSSLDKQRQALSENSNITY